MRGFRTGNEDLAPALRPELCAVADAPDIPSPIRGAIALGGSRRKLTAALRPAGWVLLAAVLVWGAQRIDDQAQLRVGRMLSRALGVPVSIRGLRPMIGPGVTLRGVRIGDLAAIRSMEIQLAPGPTWRRPKVRVRLVSPSVRLDLDQLIRRKGVGGGPQRRGALAGPASGPNRGLATALRNATTIEVVEGRVDLRLTWAGHRLRVRADGIRFEPSSGKRRVLARRATVQDDLGHRAEVSALAIDLQKHGWQAIRGAAVGGLISLPSTRDAPLRIVSARAGVAGDGRIDAVIRTSLADARQGRMTVGLRSSPTTDATARRRLERVRLELQDVALARIAPVLVALGAFPTAGWADGHVSAERRANDSVWRIKGQLKFDEMVISQAHLANHEIGPWSSNVLLDLRFDPLHDALEMSRLELVAGDLTLRLSGRARFAGPSTQVSLHVDVPPVSCQQLLAGMPAGFAPELAGMGLSGKIGLAARFKLNGRDLDAGVADVLLKPMSCRVLVDPPAADVHRLAREVSMPTIEPDGRQHRWTIGPSNRYFRPLGRISRYVRAAFIAAEDTNFYEHHGFDHTQLRRAFLYNLESGRLARGASTISQQLVKNLLLSQDRTLSRKVQEAVLTWRMEQVISKRRILELYLNMVEMGPGINGVVKAAEVYFGRSAAALTPLEAVHLAALTPAPRLLSRRFEREPPGPEWRQRLRLLLRMMRRNGSINRRELQRWSGAELVLAQRDPLAVPERRPIAVDGTARSHSDAQK